MVNKSSEKQKIKECLPPIRLRLKNALRCHRCYSDCFDCANVRQHATILVLRCQDLRDLYWKSIVIILKFFFFNKTKHLLWEFFVHSVKSSMAVHDFLRSLFNRYSCVGHILLPAVTADVKSGNDGHDENNRDELN